MSESPSQQLQQELSNSRKESVDQPQQQVHEQENGLTSNPVSRLSSAQKAPFFEDVNESPFKQSDQKNYGDKYNKVINRLRESNTLNDLARKYNKIHLPVSSQNQLESGEKQRFMIDSEAQQNTLSQLQQKHLSPKGEQSSFQTPLKDFSIGNSQQKSRFLQQKRVDSLELRSSQMSLLSRKSNDSAIPNILNQIQQNQQRYKSPRTQGLYYNTLGGPAATTTTQTGSNTLTQNLFSKDLNKVNLGLTESEQIEKKDQNSKSAYHLKKNFRNFLQDLSLGHMSNQSTTYRRLKSPSRQSSSAFLRQKSPSTSISQNQNNNISQIAGQINNNYNNNNLIQVSPGVVRGQGFDDILNKISKKKKLHGVVGVQKQTLKSQVGQGSVQREIQHRKGQKSQYNFQKSGKIYEFEKDLENMRLSSMFKFTKKSPQKKMFSSPSLKRL